MESRSPSPDLPASEAGPAPQKSLNHKELMQMAADRQQAEREAALAAMPELPASPESPEQAEAMRVTRMRTALRERQANYASGIPEVLAGSIVLSKGVAGIVENPTLPGFIVAGMGAAVATLGAYRAERGQRIRREDRQQQAAEGSQTT